MVHETADRAPPALQPCPAARRDPHRIRAASGPPAGHDTRRDRSPHRPGTRRAPRPAHPLPPEFPAPPGRRPPHGLCPRHLPDADRGHRHAPRPARTAVWATGPRLHPTQHPGPDDLRRSVGADPLHALLPALPRRERHAHPGPARRTLATAVAPPRDLPLRPASATSFPPVPRMRHACAVRPYGQRPCADFRRRTQPPAVPFRAGSVGIDGAACSCLRSRSDPAGPPARGA